MAEFRDDEGRDQFGLDSRDGLGFSFNRSGVREFIRADDDGVVTHRLFIYQNGSSPNQIEYQESEIFGKDLPVLTPAWQFYGNAPEKRGLGRPAPSHVPELARGGRGGGGGGGGGGGSNRATARNMSKGFFSAERIASISKDGIYKVQVQINPTQAGAIIGVGGETQQKLQRNTKTGISVLDGFILQVQSRTGNIKDVKEALRRIGEKLTLKKNEHIRMTQRKRKNQKTRKNRR